MGRSCLLGGVLTRAALGTEVGVAGDNAVACFEHPIKYVAVPAVVAALSPIAKATSNQNKFFRSLRLFVFGARVAIVRGRVHGTAGESL
jgi:hypothetical protein